MIKVDESDPVGEIEPSFPYRDVTVRRGIDFNNHYNLNSELGRGKFGTVYLCNDKKNGLKLAVKMVNTTKKEDRRAVEREVEIMRRLQHPRLIQLYDAIDTGKQFYVVLELIEGGELFERVIDDDFVLTERSCAVFMRQICEGVEFIHTQNILHLDLKPENILCLTKEGNRIKIIDFGLARQFDPRKKLQVLFGTPEFVAPEVVNFDQIGYGTDMWSIGVICYVLLSGLSPFMGDTDVETMANVTIAKYDFDHEAFSNISEDAKDFIRCLLIKDKEKRATAAQCRNHPWLAGRNSSKDNSSSKVKEKMKESTKKRNKMKDVEENKELVKENNDIKLKNELDVTKDNLRIFVERWREHPNSPYMIDDSLKTNNLELPRNNVESISLCGENPSPPQSITSSLDNTSEISSETFGLSNQNLIIPTLALERRASEGFYKDSLSNSNQNHQHHHRDQVSQIILAEEIIKLSEHLRSIAQMSSTDSKTNKQTKTNDNKLIINSDVNEISEKLSSIKQQRKLNGTTFNGGRNNVNKNNKDNNKFKNETKTVDSISLTSKSWKLGDDKSVTSPESAETCEKDMDLIPPWRKSKVKHRFGEMCRDVPRISNLKDIHKTMNLDEPTSAKNLLLQLLEEWDDRSGSFNIGRKSISLDWGQENIARKSINSLTQYFQFEQQKPKSTDSPTPSTSK